MTILDRKTARVSHQHHQTQRVTEAQTSIAPALSVVIPTLNEAQNIEALLRRLHRAMQDADILYEALIIDDHSTDDTVAVAERTAAALEAPVRVLLKRGKRGKTYSLMQGLDAAQYEALAILDGDLQYPPEDLPALLAELQWSDIIVGDRRSTYPLVDARRSRYSHIFNTVVGRWLFALDTDVQSGIKVFRREVYTSARLRPGRWSFDLELLAMAQEHGYRIISVEIAMQPRGAGQTKTHTLAVAGELGMRALAMRLYLATHAADDGAAAAAVPAASEQRDAQIRAYERWLTQDAVESARAHTRRVVDQYVAEASKVVTTTRWRKQIDYRPFAPHRPEHSALVTFNPLQLGAIAALLVVWVTSLVVFGLGALAATLGVVTAFYLLDLAVTLFISVNTLRQRPGAPIDDQVARGIRPEYWPSYTILCPLYHEAEVAAQFTRAMRLLDYPTDRLQVLLLTEQDDTETREALLRMCLPAHFEVITVPEGSPRTKPRACNFGLTLATGDFVVIFDAEDIPDPLQLKKAVLTFARHDATLACAQASLAFYNPNQNLLTRWFAAEYALWFGLTLPALQRMKTFLPLGGTSNHFRARILREVGAWDPFNVTEDCDLGVRLSQYGYRTAMVDSTTYEEANSNLRNWLRQRSRWIKGYAQTYLVYMRHPFSYVRQGRVNELFWLQIIVGGRAFTQMLNPILWLMLLVYLGFSAWVTPIYHILYPAPVLYGAAFCLVMGNFFYVYSYLIACLSRRQYLLTLWALLIPFYWALMSVASYIAFFQLITRPYYWEKTRHGLHLAPRRAMAPARLIGRLVAARGEHAQSRRAVRRATQQTSAWAPRWLAPLSGAVHAVAMAVMQAPLARQTHEYLAHELTVARRDFARRGLQQATLSPTISLPVAPVVDLLSTTLMPAISAVATAPAITGVAARNPERGTRYMVALRPLAPKVVAEAEPRSAPFGWLRDRWLLATLLTAIVASVAACVYYFRQGDILLYNDAESHMRLARMPFDGVTTGLAQLGSAWLPLPHILMWPFVMNDYLWSSGLAGACVGMMAFIVTSLYVYQIARLLSGSGSAAYVGALALMLNPNLLYLQATPLSESTLLAVMAGACYYFLLWTQRDQLRLLLIAAFCGLLATLTRYEGWSLFAVLTLLVIVVNTLKRRSFRRIIGEALFFAAPGTVGIGLWLTWNLLLTGNPLFFENGPYSASRQQAAYLARNQLPTYHSISMDMLTFGADVLEYAGPIIVALAVVGGFLYLRRVWRRPEGIATLALIAPVALYLYTLYKGQIVIYVPIVSANMPSDLFNVRYATSALLPLAVFVATLVGRRRLLQIAAVILIVGQAVITTTGGVISLQDGQYGLSCLQFKQSDIFLAEHYNGGRLLADLYGNPLALDVLDIHYDDVVYVGSYMVWQEALAQPQDYVDWVVVRPGDAVSQGLDVNSASFKAHFILVEQDSSGNQIYYKRGLPSLPNRPAPLQLMRRYDRCDPPYNINDLSALTASGHSSAQAILSSEATRKTLA
jgi:cellulose synthase/poly-beta-1,6-N-acetylglucosamine synthase-like glycosyltransferase